MTLKSFLCYSTPQAIYPGLQINFSEAWHQFYHPSTQMLANEVPSPLTSIRNLLRPIREAIMWFQTLLLSLLRVPQGSIRLKYDFM